MNKGKNTAKGITLIALVITIIVMLILVAVTISMALNGGLFGYAKDAKTKTENAKNAESQLASGRIKVGDTWYDSPQDYVDGKVSLDQNEGETNNKNLIEFNVSIYIDGINKENVTFQAEEGMTWEQWVQSKYNQPIKGNQIELSTIAFSDGKFGVVCRSLYLGIPGTKPDSGHYIRADEVIDNSITNLMFTGASLGDW